MEWHWENDIERDSSVFEISQIQNWYRMVFGVLKWRFHIRIYLVRKYSLRIKRYMTAGIASATSMRTKFWQYVGNINDEEKTELFHSLHLLVWVFIHSLSRSFTCVHTRRLEPLLYEFIRREISTKRMKWCSNKFTESRMSFKSDLFDIKFGIETCWQQNSIFAITKWSTCALQCTVCAYNNS